MFIPDPIRAKPGNRTITIIVFLVTIYVSVAIVLLGYWLLVALMVPEKDPSGVIGTVATMVGSAGTLAGGLYTAKSIMRKPGDPSDPKGGAP